MSVALSRSAILLAPGPDALSPRARVGLWLDGLQRAGCATTRATLRRSPRESASQIKELDVLVRHERPDVIVVTMGPFWTGALGVVLSERIWGIPTIADYRDPWIGNPYLPRSAIKERLALPLEAALEAWVLSAATVVTCASTGLAQALGPRRQSKETAVLYTGAATGPWKSDTSTSKVVRSLLGKPRPWLVYAGGIGGVQYPVSDLLRALEADGACTIVTVGDRLQGTTRVSAPSLDHDQVLGVIAAVDGMIAIEGSYGSSAPAHVPVKVFDALGAARWCTGWLPRDSEGRRIIERYHPGVVLVEPGDVDGLRRAIEAIRHEVSSYEEAHPKAPVPYALTRESSIESAAQLVKGVL